MHLVKPKKNGLLSWYFKDCIYAPINKEMIPYKEIREDFENIYCEFSRTNYQKKVSHFPNCRMTKIINYTLRNIEVNFFYTISGKYIQIRIKDMGKKNNQFTLIN